MFVVKVILKIVYRYFKKIAYSDHISAWKSKGLSDESIKLPAASKNSFGPALNHINTKLLVTLMVTV